MRAFPHHAIRRTFDLSGSWDFAFLGDADPARVDVAGIEFKEKMIVPLSFDAVAPHRGKRGLAAYRMRIDISGAERIMIDFPGLGPWSAFHVDGRRIGEHDCPFTRKRVEVGGSVARELVVLVDNRFDAKRLPGGPFPNYDWYQYGGIFRPPLLHVLPGLSIGDVMLRVKDWRKGVVEAEIMVGGCGSDKVLSCLVDGDEVVLKPFSVEAGNPCRFEFRVADPRRWDLDAPNLHNVSLRTSSDDWHGRFGLREIRTEGDKIFLNGELLKIIGVNRHETHPEFGHAVPPAVMMEDIRLIKDLGCNFVRGAHYPQDQRFLDLCDEAGLLVWEETCGWNNRREHFLDPRFMDQQLRQIDDMIHASFNHPCVVIWGFLNEGKSEQEEAPQAYEQIVSRIRGLDNSRLIACCNMYREKTASRMPRTELVCYNMYSGWYYGHYADLSAECEQWLGNAWRMLGERRPFIISEYGAEALYGWHDPFETQWSEEHQAAAVSSACREILKRDDVAGLIIWQFCDTRRPDFSPRLPASEMRRELAADSIGASGFGMGPMPIAPRCHNCKGLVDEFRRPKKAYYAMRDECAKLRDMR